MGIRMTQFVGLSPRGEQMVEGFIPTWTENSVAGMFEGDDVFMRRWIRLTPEYWEKHNAVKKARAELEAFIKTQPSVYEEQHQTTEWSSGPMIFTYLKDEDQTKWNEGEIYEVVS